MEPKNDGQKLFTEGFLKTFSSFLLQKCNFKRRNKKIFGVQLRSMPEGFDKTIKAVHYIIRRKPMKKFNIASHLAILSAVLAAALTPANLRASPYASGVTNNAGTVSFILNEGGGNVTVTYEDGTTNANFNGINTGTNLAKGLQSFSLSGHNGYAIAVTKPGNGTPSLISLDTNKFSIWNSPRGVDANKNAKVGYLFGRTYIGNSAAGGAVPNNKGLGLYALNSDLTEALGKGTNPTATPIFSTSGNGPWRMRIAPDNTLVVNDFQAASNCIRQFSADLTTSNLLLANIGPTTNHAQSFGTPYVSGSLAAGNLVVWIADPNLAVPTAVDAPSLVLGPGTSRGSFNCLFRYDIGAGPLPWAQLPNYAYTVGLDGIANLRTEVDIAPDGKIIAGFGRANLSNPDIQILNPTGTTLLYDSFQSSGGANDPWNGSSTATGAVGTYAGVRVSPDGRFLASVDVNNGITIASLTNGIPDESSIFAIPQPALGFGTAANNYVGNSRGMCWDAADNLYVCSSGQGLLRVFSLGITTTCITSNDVTGTNGTFKIALPPVSATVAVAQPQASQNYINSLPVGTPTPGIFAINLSSGTLAAPVVVNFTRSGTASYLTNYVINLGTDANGVLISSNSVTFPAGTYPGGGNWTANVQIIPTATPLTGPTLTVGIRVLGGANYLAGTPLTGTISILNTGPQLLVLTPIASSATMSRSVPNDYATFAITRFGDLNGPGNSFGSVTPNSYTVTNFTFLGTAVFPGDYTARAQRFTGSIPTDGTPGITINPGDVTVTNLVGNPVAHANLNLAPVNATITIALTNLVTGTNSTSFEGYAYSVSNNAITLTELDNTIGTEVVLWSNPLISSADSTNWTLAFASTNFAANTVLPVVVPNYTNDATSLSGGGTNDFNVKFGYSVADDSIAPSAAMVANGWTNVLKMTVNKGSPGAPSGVNVYPQGKNFRGNYALRFSMYLSMYSGAINNPAAGTFPREFAAFGINHRGTNCNWRLAAPLSAGQGNSTTNADGVWFAIGAGDNSITPADFDGFTSPALPNAGVAADLVSNTGQSQSGVFKNPPFTSMVPAGGHPVDQWVDVSVEVTRQTNATLYINRSPVLSSFTITNGGGYTNGTIMLGYLDPVANVTDASAYVYYSNVRVVELSPYITAHPSSLIVTQGANVSFTSSAAFATAPMTNTWNLFATNPPVAIFALQTDTANTTNLLSTLSLANVQAGTNYVAVFSDAAGSVTGLVASLEVIIGPTNRTVNAGSNFVQFAVIPNGPSAPTAFQWKTNGVNLVNGSHFAGVTTATLTITNAQLADAVTYTCGVTNAVGNVQPSATLTVIAPQPTISNVSLVGTNAVLVFATPNGFDNTGSFTLQSSVLVQGPYVNTAGNITGGTGTFQFTVPLTTNSTMFYRLKHN